MTQFLVYAYSRTCGISFLATAPMLAITVTLRVGYQYFDLRFLSHLSILTIQRPWAPRHFTLLFFIAAPQTVIHRVAMPTAAECLAKAQELLKADAGGQEPVGKRFAASAAAPAASGAASASASDPAERQLLTKTLRLVLYRSSDTEQLLNATALVGLLRAPDLQDRALKALELWERHKPQVSEQDREQRKWPVHPLGSKTFFLHSTVLQILQDVAKQNGGESEAPVVEATTQLLTLEDAAVQRFYTKCWPKFKTPKEKRVRKWEIAFSPLTPDAVRAEWAKMVTHTKAWPAISVDVRRGGQSELENELWETLKTRAPARGRTS